MPNLRGIIAIAVPVVTALLGILWYLGRKKATYKSPPDKIDPPVPKHSVKSADPSPVLFGKSDDPSSVLCGKSADPLSVPCGKSADPWSVSCGKSADPSTVPCGKSDDPSSVPCGKSDADSVSPQANQIEADVSRPVAEDTGDEMLPDFADDMKDIESQIIQHSFVSPSQASFESRVQMETPKITEPSQPEPIEDVISQDTTTSVSSMPSALSSLSQKWDPSENLEGSDNYNENASNDNSSSETLQDNNCDINDHVNVDNGSACDDSTNKSWHENIPEDFTDTKVVGSEFDQLSSEQIMLHEQNHVPDPKDPSCTSSCTGEESVSDSQSNGSHSPSNGQKSASPIQKKDQQSESPNNCDNLSEVSNDSGKGFSDHGNISPPDEDRLFEFNIPSNMCGLLIGTRGNTVREISQKSGTRIQVQNNPYNHKMKICIIEGTALGIEKACSIIKAKFPKLHFPSPDMAPPPQNPILIPEIMQLALPEGVTVDVIVSSIVDAGRIFVQQPTHPTYPSLERLNTFMSNCYMQEGAVPDIPRPIESGVICAAPMFNGWYRAQIMSAYDSTDECDIKYVDYGGYSRVACSLLKQIRSDFMTLPFEAVECYMANITPLENDAFYSPEAAVVLEELTQGKLLRVQVVGRAEDGVPFVHIYIITGNPMMSIMVNREMVNRGVVRWTDS